MINIFTKSRDIPATIGNVQNVTAENSRPLLLSLGWRDEVPVPPIAEGKERMSIRAVEGDGYSCAWEVLDVPISDRLAREEEARKAREAAETEAQRISQLPFSFPSGIECPVVVLTDADGKGWGVIPDGGDLVTYLDHASPRPDKSVIAQRIQEVRADRQALRDDLKANRVALQGLSVSAFNASQKAQINALIAEVLSLRKIVAKLVKSE